MFQEIGITDSYAPDGQAVITCDDSLAVLQELPDDFCKLVISSPPYNIGKEYEKVVGLEHYVQTQKPILEQLIRILSPEGSLVWQVGNFVDRGEIVPLDMVFYPLFKELGLRLRNRIVWHFDHGLHASHRFSGRYETLLWFTKTNDYCFNLDAVRVPSKYPGKLHYKGNRIGQPSGNPLGKNPSDYWKIIVEEEWQKGIIDIPNVKSNHPEKTLHPCQFPVELVERFVLALTDPKDWVLDPFGGVGSTVIAALKHHRRGISIDRDDSYCQIAIERIQALQNNDLKLRPLGKPIHQPSGREKISQRPIVWDAPEKDALL